MRFRPFSFLGLLRSPANSLSSSNMRWAAGPVDPLVTGSALDIYKMAALQTADHWMITDANGIIVEVNPAFESVTGYSQHELVGAKPNVIKSGIHDPTFYEDMWRTLQSGQPYRGVVVNRRKNGQLFHEMKSITPIKDSSGRTTHYFSIGKDISELKAAESKLERSALELERTNRELLVSEACLLRHLTILESVLSSMSEGVIVADNDGRFVMFNPAAERMVGIGSTDADPSQWTSHYGVYLPDTRTPHPTEDLPLVRAIRGQATDNAELFIRNPKKKEGVWLAVRGTPLSDKDGSVIGGLIVTRDITQDKWVKRATKELRANREEMKIAERIQRQFFPAGPPVVEGLEFGGASQAAVITGGDYFDYVQMPDGGLLLVMGDVSGHGFGPALLMASVRAYVRALAASGVGAREMLDVVNRLIAADTDAGDFVTMSIVRLDPVCRSCAYVSAGHPASYLLDAAGNVKQSLESMVPPLGMLPELGSFDMVPIEMSGGDILLMLTDGIIEAEDSAGTPFGTEQALDVVRRNRHRPAPDIVDILHKTVAKRCAGTLQDDITSIVVKVRPDGAGREPR